MNGIISWTAIEDRNRGSKGWLIEEDLGRIFRDLPYSFAVDMWARQENYVEVWVEKEALGNVIEKACRSFRVRHMACKGYLSASEAWRAGKRMHHALLRRQNPVIIHLGDHDPSGIDMSRDNEDRVSMFGGCWVDLKRIALNMDQVEQYNPPPNPAKVTDSRAEDYIRRFGSTSWELDALEPSTLIDLIRSEIEPLINYDLWEEDSDREDEMRKRLREMGQEFRERFEDR